MAFTGKATYDAGVSLPESTEDVGDLVGINTPFETPLLDALGDAARPARSTVHEWLEDSLLPNSDKILDVDITSGTADTQFGVAHASRFQVGDQIRIAGLNEIMMVTAIDLDGGQITLIRSYGGTTAQAVTNNAVIQILGNAALEGADANGSRFTARARKSNYTQIFSAGVEVSGSELAVRQIGVADELDYQKQQRTRELLRDLESVVLNGRAPAADMQGTSSVRRSMNGIIAQIATNIFKPNVNGFPNSATLTEDQLNTALRDIWKNSNGRVDLVIVGGTQKRAINSFVSSDRRFFPAEGEMFKNLVSVYESDFGVCQIIVSRSVPLDTVILLDSSRVDVMPLAGRSFHYKQLASTGDRESGVVIGEYTLEFRNENAHGIITGLS